MPVMTIDLFLFHFKVRNCCQQFWVPVDQPLIAIDQAILMHIDKDFTDSSRQTIIHGKAFARPIWRRAQRLQLAADRAARLIFPFPDFFNEFFTAQVTAINTISRQHPFHHHLCGNAGVVHPWLPERVPTTHAVKSDQNILQRKGQRMTNMQ